MPHTPITTPPPISGTDRLTLGTEAVRAAGPAGGAPLPGHCYCQCTCAEASTYAAGCAACCCFETE